MTSDIKKQLKDIKDKIKLLNDKDLPIICRETNINKYASEDLDKMVIVKVDDTDKSFLNDKLYQRFKDRINGGK